MTTSGLGADPSVDTRKLETSTTWPTTPAALELRPEHLGRYLAIDELGRGGMGRVLRAYDPKLQREVALKVLRTASIDPTARARLVREARTMARLSHPNVVAVYDVEDDPEQEVMLAMELVRGTTLREWLRRRPRSWPEILAAFVDAGRGLAAAHDQGLLHRDFKPSNVVLAEDDGGQRGPCKVTDFGLAKPEDHHPPEASSPDALGPTAALDTGDDVTEHGVVLGTTRYMAPEQHMGSTLTSAADQYAFCASLWEALFGVAPFGGDSSLAIVRRILAGEPQVPPRAAFVPQWLRRACERGLAADPARRWPSMHALLDALAEGRARATRRRAAMALAGLVLAGMGATAWWRYDLARREAACEAEGDEIEAVWNATRAQALRDGMLASGANEAATTADKVLPWLAEQAAQWRDARVSACTAAHVHARWEPAVLERSLWCLDDRRMELESLVVELSAADADVMRRAVGAAAGLESIAACSDERALEVLVIPPVDATTLREVRMELARAGGLRRAGRYDKGLEQATSALMQAREHGWAPLVAVAHLEVGRLLDDRGAYAEAEAELERAYFEAAKAGVPIVSFQAATALVDTVGVDEARHADGHRWARLADVALGGVADREQLARSSLLAHIASLHADTGAYTDARALYEQALSLREQALGPDHPEVVTLLHNLAFVDEKTGDYRDAKARLERALAVRIETLGANHPDVATSLNNLANVEHALDANAQAMALHTRALAIRRAALGPDHPEVAASLNNLANLHSVANEPAKAMELYERALAIRTRVHGPSHPDVAQTLHNLASIHDLTGEPERALPLFERALAIREETLGPTHPAVAQTLGSMGTTQLALGHDARARESLERAVDIREKALGPTHPKLASTLVNLASVYVASDRHDEARALLERALAIREEALGPTHADVVSSLNQLAICILTQGQARQALPLAQRAVDTVTSSGVEGSVAAKARFVLAQVLWELPPDQGRDRPRARALAQEAHATSPAGLGEDIAAWLAGHGS